jgi:hypothetical protein
MTAAALTAERVFRASLLYTSALTLAWLVLLVRGGDGGALFDGYRIDRESLARVALGFSVFTVVYGWLWYRLRRALLEHVAGFTKQELAAVFSSRFPQPSDPPQSFDLQELLARHSERRIRIIDMIGRRGRGITLGIAYTAYVYSRLGHNPSARFLTAGLVDGLLDAVVLSWTFLAAYRSDGLLGRAVFGAPSRVMDGVLGRANNLSSVTLWNAFKLVMVPLGIALAARFPASRYAPLFGFIWLSYQVADTMAEVVGSLLGKQRLRVWGIGEVNRKSWAGTGAAFLGSLGTCLLIAHLHGLPWPWLILAFAVSLSNTALEILSPRGTDDFTMATGNALVCWAFGAWLC